MARRLGRRLSPLIACLATAGCVQFGPTFDPYALPSTDEPVTSKYLDPNSPAAQSVAGVIPAKPLAAPLAATPESPPNGAPPVAPTAAAANDPQALQKVVAELQSLGTIDPAMQKQLIADLQQTDPALWPMMMQTFRAGVKFRERGAAAKTDKPTPADVVEKQPTAVVSDEPPRRAAEPPKEASPKETAAPAPTVPNLEALASSMNIRGSSTPGLSLPATQMLSVALAEAQRKEAEATAGIVAPTLPQLGKAKTTVRRVSSKDPPPADDENDDRPADEPAAPTTDWSTAVADAIAALESQTQEPPRSAQEVTRHAWLRVLYLAADRRDDALKPIPGIAASEQDFWTEQLYALATYLDTERLTDPARRSAEASRHLTRASARLGEASTLVVKNPAFCTEVSSYGVYTKFKEDSFKAGQAVILYTEVENFKSEETAKGFHTALRSSYQILDAQGRRVAENDLALTEEHCQNHRRDYFIRYFLSVPDRIYPGKYTLQLTIVDTLSQKIGQSSIEFTVVDK
jgi:hypothetical protein